MVYDPSVWVDDSATGPFLEAANLNKMEQGIAGAHALVASLEETVRTNQTDNLTRQEASGFYVKALEAAPIGTVITFAGPNVNGFRPYWLPCDGGYVSKTEFPQLFAILGSTWGASNATSFRLPPKDVFLKGSGAQSVGATGGAATHTLTVDQMPAHTHQIGQHSVNSRASTLYKSNAASGSQWDIYSYGSQQSPERLVALSTGGGKPFPIEPPYAVMNLLIRAK